MIDSKGTATPLLKGGEAPDVEKVAKAKALTFDNTEIADGVRLSGVFAGTVDGAQTFRKDYARAANVRTAIQELMEINEQGYETLSPTARARAATGPLGREPHLPAGPDAGTAPDLAP